MSSLRLLLPLVGALTAAGAAPALAGPGDALNLGLGPVAQGEELAPGDSEYQSQAYMSTPPGYHAHDGFYLRFLIGPSVVAAVANDELETSVSGAGASFHIAAGAALIPNVILYGEIFANTAIGPTIESGVAEIETDEDTSFSLVGIGPGVAIYLPGNFYLSSTLAFTRLVLDPNTEQDDDEATSDLGATLTAAVGKEWWVGANVGLGAALQIYGGAMKDGDDSENEEGEDLVWGAGGVLLAFSATIN